MKFFYYLSLPALRRVRREFLHLIDDVESLLPSARLSLQESRWANSKPLPTGINHVRSTMPNVVQHFFVPVYTSMNFSSLYLNFGLVSIHLCFDPRNLDTKIYFLNKLLLFLLYDGTSKILFQTNSSVHPT